MSPVYKCGIGIIEEEKGIGLRFPRFIRIRDDKKTSEATIPKQIIEIYKNQAIVNIAGDDDEFY